MIETFFIKELLIVENSAALRAFNTEMEIYITIRCIIGRMSLHMK